MILILLKYCLRIKSIPICYFLGILFLKKILKAHVVKKTSLAAPITHNLIRLAEVAKLDLSDEEFKFLGEVNEFNLSARYPDDKQKFYLLCTKEFTGRKYHAINILYAKLCKLIMQ